MKDDFENIFYSEEKIKERVMELGAQITSDYKGKSPLLLGVLKGCFIFLADLARVIDINCEIQFVSASSYGQSAVTSGNVNINGAANFEVRNRDIIIVEDILDTGITLTRLKEFLESQEPASVKTCVLLDKVSRRQAPIEADYVGFECPDAFVVGYGLDYSERYRNVPYVASIKPEIYS